MPSKPRTKNLGDLGERLAPTLLQRAGFTEITDLNEVIPNHPFADFIAERGGGRFLISVRTRNRLTAKGKLNSTYNVRRRAVPLEPLAKIHQAVPAWVAIQVDAEQGTISAYFGTIAQLGNRLSIPMKPEDTAKYECLADNEPTAGLTMDLSNQPRK